MRRILVEHARKKKSQKRGGHLTRQVLDESFVASHDKLDELLSIHEVLNELEGHDEQAARLVKLRYFVGMKHKDVADAMNITRGSADHLWQTARNWLYRRLS